MFPSANTQTPPQPQGNPSQAIQSQDIQLPSWLVQRTERKWLRVGPTKLKHQQIKRQLFQNLLFFHIEDPKPHGIYSESSSAYTACDVYRAAGNGQMDSGFRRENGVTSVLFILEHCQRTRENVVEKAWNLKPSTLTELENESRQNASSPFTTFGFGIWSSNPQYPQQPAALPNVSQPMNIPSQVQGQPSSASFQTYNGSVGLGPSNNIPSQAPGQYFNAPLQTYNLTPGIGSSINAASQAPGQITNIPLQAYNGTASTGLSTLNAIAPVFTPMSSLSFNSTQAIQHINCVTTSASAGTMGCSSPLYGIGGGPSVPTGPAAMMSQRSARRISDEGPQAQKSHFSAKNTPGAGLQAICSMTAQQFTQIAQGRGFQAPDRAFTHPPDRAGFQPYDDAAKGDDNSMYQNGAGEYTPDETDSDSHTTSNSRSFDGSLQPHQGYQTESPTSPSESSQQQYPVQEAEYWCESPYNSPSSKGKSPEGCLEGSADLFNSEQQYLDTSLCKNYHRIPTVASPASSIASNSYASDVQSPQSVQIWNDDNSVNGTVPPQTRRQHSNTYTWGLNEAYNLDMTKMWSPEPSEGLKKIRKELCIDLCHPTRKLLLGSVREPKENGRLISDSRHGAIGDHRSGFQNTTHSSVVFA